MFENKWFLWEVILGLSGRGAGGECVGQEGKEANKGCAIKNCGQLWAQPAGDSGK